MKENVIKEKQEVIDVNTGELVEMNETLNVSIGEEPPFYKVYLADIGKIHGLSPYETKLWQILCANMSFGNRIVLVKSIKQKIIEEIGCKPDTIKAAIKTLVNQNLLIREDRALYTINPNYAARGKWEDVKALRVIIDYNDRGRTVEVKKLNSKTIQVKEKQLDLWEKAEEL